MQMAISMHITMFTVLMDMKVMHISDVIHKQENQKRSGVGDAAIQCQIFLVITPI